MIMHGTRTIVYMCIVVIILVALYAHIEERGLSGTVVSSKESITSRQGNTLSQELQSDGNVYDESNNLDELGSKTDLKTTQKQDESKTEKEDPEELQNNNSLEDVLYDEHNRSGAEDILSQSIGVGITLTPQIHDLLSHEKDDELSDIINSPSSQTREESGDLDDEDDGDDNNVAIKGFEELVTSEDYASYEGSGAADYTNNTAMLELIDDYEAEDDDNDDDENGDDENENNMSDAGTEEEFMTRLKDRFKSRQQLAKEGCHTHHNPVYSTSRTMSRFLFYSYKYNLMVCAVAKTGASTWKSHLLAIKGISTKGINVHSGHYEQMIRARSILGKSGLSTKLPKAIKVLTVRHPLDRLVSAYMDKFNGGNPISNPDSGKIRYFWRPAGHRLRKSMKSSGKYQMSFYDYLRQVILDHWSGDENTHWSKMYGTCSPCQISYNYIMKTETYSEDLAYIVKALGIKEVDATERRHGLSGGLSTQSTQSSDHPPLRSSTLQYYKDIPVSMMDKLEKLYHTDMDIFGYEFPSDIMNIINDYRDKASKENTR